MTYNKEQLMEALRHVSYPEKGESIVALGLVEKVEINGKRVEIKINLPRPNSPFTNSIKKACVKVMKEFSEELEVEVEMGTKISAGRTDDKKILPKVKNIIAIASGKGGVGKSTVATNLAVALAKQGAKTGLIDADVYGPSMPKMFGCEDARPVQVRVGTRDMINPEVKYGVKILSVGFFVPKEQALVWRGPMATNALQQLINEGNWGDLDYLLIDLPPGTGDIHLTMVQTIPVTGVIMVSTPQEVALADVVKGIGMFKGDKINVPIVGLVENMSWFTPAELPDNKYYLFGKDGCKKLADKLNIPLLGQIPIVQSICEGGDKGVPAALDEESVIGKAFYDLADNVALRVKERNENITPTKIVEITNNDGCSNENK